MARQSQNAGILQALKEGARITQISFLPMLEPRDLEHCLQELAQCGAVILRMMQFVENEMEA